MTSGHFIKKYCFVYNYSFQLKLFSIFIWDRSKEFFSKLTTLISCQHPTNLGENARKVILLMEKLKFGRAILVKLVEGKKCCGKNMDCIKRLIGFKNPKWLNFQKNRKKKLLEEICLLTKKFLNWKYFMIRK